LVISTESRVLCVYNDSVPLATLNMTTEGVSITQQITHFTKASLSRDDKVSQFK